MISILLKLIGAFGATPWLERFLSLGFDSKMLQQFTSILCQVTGTQDVNNAVKRVSADKTLELELQRALLVAETNYWQQCIQDKQNARDRDLAIQRMRGQNIRANIMLVMAMLGIILSVGALILFKRVLNADGVGMLSAVAAVFGACLKDAYSFEFGSSKVSLEDHVGNMRAGRGVKNDGAESRDILVLTNLVVSNKQ